MSNSRAHHNHHRSACVLRDAPTVNFARDRCAESGRTRVVDSVEERGMYGTGRHDSILPALTKSLDSLCKLAEHAGKADRTCERMFFGALITVVSMVLVARGRRRNRRVTPPYVDDVALERWKHAGVVLGVLVSLSSLVQGLLRLVELVLSML